MYASFLEISGALHLDIFHQPLEDGFFDSFASRMQIGYLEGYSDGVCRNTSPDLRNTFRAVGACIVGWIIQPF